MVKARGVTGAIAKARSLVTQKRTRRLSFLGSTARTSWKNGTCAGKDESTCLKPHISGAQLEDVKQVDRPKLEQLAAQLKATKGKGRGRGNGKW